MKLAQELGLLTRTAREYSSVQGRWISPDPAGLAAVDASDPQTWNRYAYVRNDPLNTTDPSGLHDTPDECFFDPFCDLTTWGFPVPPPPSFLPNPTPPIDWQTILFGPFNPSLLIFNWNLCFNALGKLVPCTDPSAVIYCSDAASPDQAPAQPPYGACSNSMPQFAIGRHRFPANNATPQKPPLSQRAKTYFTQYVPCAAAGWITYSVGDSEHANSFFGSNFAIPLSFTLVMGPKGLLTGVAVATAYDLNAALNINATCTAQVYGNQQ